MNAPEGLNGKEDRFYQLQPTGVSEELRGPRSCSLGNPLN